MQNRWWMAAVAAVLMALPAGAQDTLRVIQGAPPTIAMTDLMVAQDLGFLEEENIEVVIEHSQNGAVATQVVAASQGDIADVTLEPYLSGYEKGMRGKFISALGNLNVYILAVPVDSPIQNIEDLAGKKIGVLSIGSQAILYIKSAARMAGIDPESITFLPVGFGDTAGAALRTGQVDALAQHRIGIAGLLRAGFDFRYLFHPTVAEVANSGYFVSDDVLAQKRPQLVGFLRALIKAEIFVRANPEAALQIYWQHYPQAKPAGDEAEAIRLGVAELTFNPSANSTLNPERVSALDPVAINEVIAVLRGENYISSDITSADVIATGVYEEAISGINVEAIQELAKNWN